MKFQTRNEPKQPATELPTTDSTAKARRLVLSTPRTGHSALSESGPTGCVIYCLLLAWQLSLEFCELDVADSWDHQESEMAHSCSCREDSVKPVLPEKNWLIAAGQSNHLS